jgi:acyl-ACP thioesterase
MTKFEKIRALIEFEINWAIVEGDTEKVSEITEYITALFDRYTDQAIHKLYANKFED